MNWAGFSYIAAGRISEKAIPLLITSDFLGEICWKGALVPGLFMLMIANMEVPDKTSY
jgi:hypothetical protein